MCVFAILVMWLLSFWGDSVCDIGSTFTEIIGEWLYSCLPCNYTSAFESPFFGTFGREQIHLKALWALQSSLFEPLNANFADKCTTDLLNAMSSYYCMPLKCGGTIFDRKSLLQNTTSYSAWLSSDTNSDHVCKATTDIVQWQTTRIKLKNVTFWSHLFVLLFLW